MTRRQQRHGAEQRGNAPTCGRVVDARDELIATTGTNRGKRQRTDLLERLDRNTDVGRDRLERPTRCGNVGCRPLGGEEITRRRESLTEPRLRTTRETRARWHPTHE